MWRQNSSGPTGRMPHAQGTGPSGCHVAWGQSCALLHPTPEVSSTLCSRNGGGEEEGRQEYSQLKTGAHYSSHYGRSPWIKKESGNGGRRAHLYDHRGQQRSLRRTASRSLGPELLCPALGPRPSGLTCLGLSLLPWEVKDCEVPTPNQVPRAAHPAAGA